MAGWARKLAVAGVAENVSRRVEMSGRANIVARGCAC